MIDPMGTFRVDVEVEHPDRPSARRVVASVLVDTGAELSWFPTQLLDEIAIRRIKQWHFRQADGSVLTRWAGVAIVRVAGVSCGDEVVFGEANDLVLLGARSLEGLNLKVDPWHKTLIDAGPAPAAAAA
jgi:predicted aspartyl protease